MARRTTQWFLSLQMTLYLLLIFVGGNEDADDAYKNGRNLVLEYFLPINLPPTVDMPLRREKRDVEGSGEDENVLSELKKVEDADNSTQSAFATFTLGEPNENAAEGSGEVDDRSESDASVVPILAETEVFTTEEAIGNSNNITEMIFDKSEDFDEVSTIRTEETTTAANERAAYVTANQTADGQETTTGEPGETTTESPESRQDEITTPALEETATVKHQTTTATEETTTESIHIPKGMLSGDDDETTKHSIETSTAATETTVSLIPAAETTVPLTTTADTSVPPLSASEMTVPPLPAAETTVLPITTTFKETTTTESPTLAPIIIPQVDAAGRSNSAFNATTAPQSTEANTKTPAVPSTPEVPPPVVVPNVTEGLPVPSKPPQTPEPVVEEILNETKIGKNSEAMPGNILQKENLSLAADTLLIANTRLMDSEENVQLSSSEPKRLGAYIVIGLILLSFSSLVGYITFKRRMNRKRQEFESNQESNDTEKALLSLSDYKDNSELEENHLKNNEITPIVVKSNSQINKFEKNTNFSSPKNLNTIANEKNIEKDNVLKSTAENLTQVIIEDSPKELEEEKGAPGLEKLIVKTRIDQDSIPKKAIIINRSSAGYLPIPQDNS